MGIKLSICIPTYNRAKFLPDLFESIVNNLDENNRDIVEVVVSDNASSDNTVEVINKYKNSFKNFVYFRWDENMGADRNFLKVVEIANGEYCWLMGSDDKLENNSINKILNFIFKQNLELTGITLEGLSYDFQMKNINKNIKTIIPGKKYNNEVVIYNLEEIIENFFGSFGYISSQVINRKIWIDVTNEDVNKLKKYFNAYVHVYIISRMIQKNPVWGFISTPCVGWRTNNDSFLSELGVYKRIKLDVDGYGIISNDVFGGNSAIHHKNMNLILKNHIKSHVYMVKFFNNNVLLEFKLFLLLIKHYYRYAFFWYFILPFLLTPTIFLKIMRMFYRFYKRSFNY